MMISPDWYYEEYLKGKTAAEIMAKIRSLKKEIGRLKKVLEDPSYPDREWAMHPSESVQLSCTKQYLEYAKKALAEAGGEYPLSKADVKVSSFNERLAAIKKIEFKISNFPYPSNARVISVEDDGLLLCEGNPYAPKDMKSVHYQCDVADFISSLRTFEFGGWRRRYDTFRYGVAVMDGTSWELKLTFSDGKASVRFIGDNAYPYNYEQLEELFADLWTEGFDSETL